MPRKPDIKNKDTFQIKARDESEKQIIHDLKKLAIQDEVEIRDLVFEGIIKMLNAHHWYELHGNPQLQLPRFQTGELTPLIPKCKCGKDSVWHGLHVASCREYDFCSKCFSGLLGRHDYKVWKWTNATKETKEMQQ